MSSFWKPVCNYKHIIKTFVSPGKDQFLCIYELLLFILSFGSKKRMSFFFSLRSGKKRSERMDERKGIIFSGLNGKWKASMAVEASIALPVFLFFLMNILFSFDMLRLHGNLTAAMHQTGNRMAFHGYAYRAMAEDGSFITEGLDSFILSVGYARSQVIGILGREYLDRSCLSSGVSSLDFMKSSVMEEGDIIELVAAYKVKPFISLMGFPDFAMENRYYGRAWTGYDVEGRQSDMSAEDPVVYVAEHGTVYHMARNCSYLTPAVEAVSNGTVAELRNAGGAKYYDCERCRSNKYQAVVYITSQGNKIHGSLACSGLKRTVYTVHLSEVEGKGRCSKCGG